MENTGICLVTSNLSWCLFLNNWTQGIICKLLEPWASCHIKLSPDWTRCWEAFTSPVLKLTNMIHSRDVVSNKILITSVNQLLLSLSKCLDQILICFLLVHDLGFSVLILSLLSLLCLQCVIFSQLPQLLLEHRLMVPILDVLFNLLLWSLQLVHNLKIALLYSLTIVTLSFKIKLVIHAPRVLPIIPSSKTLLVNLSKSHSLISIFVLSSQEVILHLILLWNSVGHQASTSDIVAFLDRRDSTAQKIIMFVPSCRDLFIDSGQWYWDLFPLFRCHSFLVIFDLVLLLSLYFHILLNLLKFCATSLLDSLHSNLIILFHFLLSLNLFLSFSLFKSFQSLLHFLKFLLFPLSILFFVLLKVFSIGSKNSFEFKSLIFHLQLTLKLILNLDAGSRSKSSGYLASLVIFLLDKLINRDRSNEVEAHHHWLGSWRVSGCLTHDRVVKRRQRLGIVNWLIWVKDYKTTLLSLCVRWLHLLNITETTHGFHIS